MSTEHHLTIQRHARYRMLGTPGPHIREVWFVLHGYGMLAEYFIRPFRTLDDGARLIVAPEAFNRFYLKLGGRVGATWMTREDRERDIADQLAYLDLLHRHIMAPLRDVHVVVLGFSQGATAACRWALRGQARLNRLVCWAGNLPHDLQLAQHTDALNQLGMIYVLGDQDAYVTPDRLATAERRLAHAQVNYTLVPYTGGHRIMPAVLKEVVALTGPA
ncbi:MAG: dienelactone hydrolase family protein [Bacteroidota bacterium]